MWFTMIMVADLPLEKMGFSDGNNQCLSPKKSALNSDSFLKVNTNGKYYTVNMIVVKVTFFSLTTN